MQTPSLRANTVQRRHCRHLVTAICTTMTLVLSGCAMPRIDGKDEAAQSRTSCEVVYERANRNRTLSLDASTPAMLRFVYAQRAQRDWLNVASQCSGRFQEGAVRSAESQYLASTIADHWHLDFSAAGTASVAYAPQRLDGWTNAVLSPQALGSLALAEDRAGFAWEVLAPRSGAEQAVSMSDIHKATAQQLISAGSATDTRRKVYDVKDLLHHPDTVVDNRGIAAPTTAAVEMDCARELLAATSTASLASDAAPNATATQRGDSLIVVASLVANRLMGAFHYGYPCVEALLLKQ